MGQVDIIKGQIPKLKLLENVATLKKMLFP